MVPVVGYIEWIDWISSPTVNCSNIGHTINSITVLPTIRYCITIGISTCRVCYTNQSSIEVVWILLVYFLHSIKAILVFFNKVSVYTVLSLEVIVSHLFHISIDSIVTKTVDSNILWNICSFRIFTPCSRFPFSQVRESFLTRNYSVTITIETISIGV